MGYPDTPISDISDLGDVAKLAEDLGFSALWIRDVPFYDPNFGDVGQGLDPMVTMEYLAAKTKKIVIGTAGMIAPLREPIHLAKAAVSANVLTNNRFILSMSSGDRPVEYPAFKKNFENRAETFRKSWKMIRELADPDKPFPVYKGKQYGDLSGDIDFVPKMDKGVKLPMVAIGRARQEFDWLANEADAWIWHGVNPNLTEKIVKVIEELNKDNTWHPFGYANFVELLDNPDAPAELYNNIYLRGGSRSIAEYYRQRKELGLFHVTINLKPTNRPYEDTLKDLAENVLDKVNN